MYHITFQQIHYFLTLAKTLSFTDTSQMLYVSQPTLSKQIGALETELGFPLFERTKRSVSLTPEGKLLYKDWSAIQNLMDTSIYNAKLLKRTPTGKLRIGFADTFETDDMLASTMSIFHSNYPDIDIDLESHGFKSLRNLLYAKDLDIIFLPEFELSHYQGIEKLEFQALELGIAVPITNPLSKKDHVTIPDLKNEPIVALSSKESSSGVNKMRDYFIRYGIEPNIVKHASNLQSLTIALKSGVGCTICHNKIKSSQIRIYDLEEQPYDSNIYAVWCTDHTSMELDLFQDILKDFAMKG